MLTRKQQQRRFLGGFFVLLLGSVTLYLASLTQGPDLDVIFVREVHSKVDVATLDKAIWAVINWRKWHFMVTEVKVLDALGREYSMKDQTVTTGAHLRYTVVPKGQKWRTFELYWEVLNYQPQKQIKIHLMKDTSGKISRIFDQLDWQIDLIPQVNGTLIRGTAFAHTCNWRSRIFAHIAQRIMMNQVFYPDLVQLAELSHPTSTNPLPPTQQ